MQLEITGEAARQLKRLMAEKQREGEVLRIFVREGGCRGYSYGMAFDRTPREDDVIVDRAGIRVVVDPASAAFLDGATVDYVDSLMGAGFTIQNPNAVSTCGCGQSFRTREHRGRPRSCGGA